MVEVLGNERFLPLEYGDLQLPEFDDQQVAIRNLDLSFDAFRNYMDVANEGALGLKGSFALQKIDDLVADFVIETARSVAIPQDEMNRLMQAVRVKDWAGVLENSSEKFVLRELIARANRLKFQTISEWVESGTETGFTEVGNLEYQYLMPALAANDRMYIKMVSQKRPINSDQRHAMGLENELAVIEERGGKIVEVTFDKAYPEEIEAMECAYEDLLGSLEDLSKRVLDNPRLAELIERKIAYYSILLKAISSSDLEAMRQADALLPQQIIDGSDVAHFHPIEVGYMEDRIVRAPEIGLRAMDLNAVKAQNYAQDTKARMLRSLRDPRMADLKAVQGTISLVERSNAVVRHFLGSGMEMDLKPAGQILPNDFEARVAGGVDSSLDIGSVMSRYPLAMKSFIAVFGQDTYDKFCGPYVDFNEDVGGSIASHELGHAIGLVEGSKERLGETTLVSPYIEEWKSTTAGLINNYYIPVLNGERDPGVLQSALIGQIMTACRYAMGRNHAHVVAYFRHSQMLMKTAEDVGVLNFDGQFWSIDLSPEKALAYFEALFAEYREVMELYGQGSEQDLRDYLSENLKSMPFMEFACSRIPAPDAEKFTPAELAKLPPVMTEAEKRSTEDITVEVRDGLMEVYQGE